MSAIQELLRSELRATGIQLGLDRTPTDTAIHEARQHVKRARALLRLLRQTISDRSYRGVNRHLRHVNRHLRYVRDRAAIAETLQWVGARSPYMGPAVLSVRQYWRRHQWRRVTEDFEQARRLARKHLARAVAAARHWKTAPAQDELVLHAIRLAYRKARKAYRRATRADSAASWHDCRKAAKSLYYQSQAVSPAARKSSPMIRQAHLLEAILGRDRDLRLLAAEIRRSGAEQTSNAAVLLEHIQLRRAALRQKAKRVATQLFRDHHQADPMSLHPRRRAGR